MVPKGVSLAQCDVTCFLTKSALSYLWCHKRKGGEKKWKTKIAYLEARWRCSGGSVLPCLGLERHPLSPLIYSPHIYRTHTPSQNLCHTLAQIPERPEKWSNWKDGLVVYLEGQVSKPVQCNKCKCTGGKESRQQDTDSAFPSKWIQSWVFKERGFIKDSRGVELLFRGNGSWLSRRTWNIRLGDEGGENGRSGGKKSARVCTSSWKPWGGSTRKERARKTPFSDKSLLQSYLGPRHFQTCEGLSSDGGRSEALLHRL